MKARSTKAFWTASYMFSWVMQKMIQELIKREKITEEDIISPYYSESMSIPKKVGLFPDRLFIRGKIDDFSSIKDSIVKELSDKFGDISDISEYLGGYLSISVIEIEQEEDGKGLISLLNQYLDTQELWQKTTKLSSDHMSDFLENNNNFICSHFEENDSASEKSRRAFKSTSEIAASGWLDTETTLILNDKKDIDYSYYSGLEDFYNCYKYMAIVKADGDGFGRYIKEQSVESMKEFSKHFFDFSIKAFDALQSTKAVPVYVGGDDLFFFAPVREKDPEKDVFYLISIIDECFRKFRSELGDDASLSMSYGVSIFYYKSPMSEAMDVAGEMLEKAKTAPMKDSVALSIRKHSGKKIEFLLPSKHSYGDLDEEELFGETYADIWSDNIPRSLYEVSCELMRSFSGKDVMIDRLIYWLDEMYESVVAPIVGNRNRLRAVFDNFFDEDIHEEKKKEGGFLDLVQRFIFLMNQSKDTKGMSAQEKKNLIHAILRYCQFVNAKEEK